MKNNREKSILDIMIDMKRMADEIVNGSVIFFNKHGKNA